MRPACISDFFTPGEEVKQLIVSSFWVFNSKGAKALPSAALLCNYICSFSGLEMPNRYTMMRRIIILYKGDFCINASQIKS